MKAKSDALRGLYDVAFRMRSPDGEPRDDDTARRYAAHVTAPGFAMVPGPILKHPQLSDGAVRIAGLLLYYAGAKPEARRSEAQLADDIGKDVRTVRRALRQLVEAGLVTVRRTRHECNHYGVSVLRSMRGAEREKV